jgi:rRNA-processing protein FCF1
MLIIPDTNFLIYLASYKLWYELERIYGHYSLLILPQVVYELEQLSKKTKGKDKENALLALEIVKKMPVKAQKGPADPALVKTAKLLYDLKKEFIIGTMDKELITKLKTHRARILTIRQKKYLEEY